MSLLKRGAPLLLACLTLLCLSSAPCLHAQAAPSTEGPLQTGSDVARVHLIGNDDIVRMAKAGLGDDVLVQTIQLQPGRYDVTPDDLIALKSAGLSDRVLAAMQAHGAPGAAHGSAPGDPERPTLRPYSDAARSPYPGTLPAGVDEIGVYYRLPPPRSAGLGTHQAADANAAWAELKTERVVFKSGGAAKSILTHGIVSKDMNGHLDGPKSSLVLPTGVQILIYAPAGTDANEYAFLRLREHKDNREFRTLTGGVFHSESGADRDEVQFDPHKLAPQLYTFTVPIDIEKGEYGVLPPGSSNIQGISGSGKIFTFSIAE
jgi:hypothetical protein